MTRKLRVTFAKSISGGTEVQRATVRSLGFKRLNEVKIFEDTPVVRGMLNRVSHLVKVEEA
jgi:large subunit ribosomal protein L30